MRPLRISGQSFVDDLGHLVHLRGINLSGDSKNPKKPNVPSHCIEGFWDQEQISFEGRPFEIEDADEHLARISSWGFNIVRFIVTWEAIEHDGPGVYDEEYMDYVVEVLRKCGQHGLYVLMDPHQDVWSRFSGGSGAPLWTFHAAGMQPKNFPITQAAIVHNTSTDPTAFPKMIWSTNYERLAAATMFILFFAGRYFAPKAEINGHNIQDLLQTHFLKSMSRLADKIRSAGNLENVVVIGWESMNEPSSGFLGIQDLTVIPKDQHLRKGTCPTPFQAILTGSGLPQEVETWDFGQTGPHKTGTTVVDPGGTSIWTDLSHIDLKYGWIRNAAWNTAECIWALHGVWDTTTNRILKPDYFARGPDGKILDSPAFLDCFWMEHFRAFKSTIRASHTNAIIFCQPPVLVVPPRFTLEDRTDEQIVYSPHYYDGLTLMNKHWNTWYNVDVLGVLRGRYLSPVFAVRFGLKAIRNCLRDQLIAIKEEGLANLGNYPCFISEIGIPFDMDHGQSYITNDYEAQIGALDANAFALESARVNYTFWQYSVVNSHEWGDEFNGEDLSFWSNSTATGDSASLDAAEVLVPKGDEGRAAEAFIRPAAYRTAVDVLESCFDLSRKLFTLKLKPAKHNYKSPVAEILVPRIHYLSPLFKTSIGSIEYSPVDQHLSWYISEVESHHENLWQLEITEGGLTQPKKLFCSIF